MKMFSSRNKHAKLTLGVRRSGFAALTTVAMRQGRRKRKKKRKSKPKRIVSETHRK